MTQTDLQKTPNNQPNKQTLPRWLCEKKNVGVKGENKESHRKMIAKIEVKSDSGVD